MKRYVCIHGHFYQPPRENPWLEFVERQESAHPYHDWNEKITIECYAPNAASRILNSDKHIIAIVNNYSKISFNFGPTLLSWMEKEFSWVYESLLEADRISMKNFGGHGSAIAQVYNHIIMPLSSYHDKWTQVYWGVRDFERRFNRFPEGMWLPETAVDLETLEVLADQNIKFTILAPHQAKRIRPLRGGRWKEVTAATLDTKKAYLCRLPSGKDISLFFYDGPISQDVAFGGLLSDGKLYAQRLSDAFRQDDGFPQLVNIATDGETYGHHHRFGDMALAYCIYFLESKNLARITVYGEYLEKFPPKDEVQIAENTSWSCAHGIERWRGNCGCDTGMNPGWTQEWRRPLREAVDLLDERATAIYKTYSSKLLKDPWRARDDYINVILDRTPKNVEDFLHRNARKDLSKDEKVIALKLLEMSRNAMLMLTSCGWFFDDISGLEATQIMTYAARVVQLARDVSGKNLETDFLTLLEKAKSNDPAMENGKRIYEKIVFPKVLDLLRVGAHGVMASMFLNGSVKKSVYCYEAENVDLKSFGLRKFVLHLGKVRVFSSITWEEDLLGFASCYLGGLQLFCSVIEHVDEASYALMLRELETAFEDQDVPEIVRKMDKHFKGRIFSLKHLFRDEQYKIVDSLIEDALDVIMVAYEEAFNANYSTMKVLRELKIPLPRAFRATVDVTLSGKLDEILKNPEIDVEDLEKICREIKDWNVLIDEGQISKIACEKINSLLESFKAQGRDLSLLLKAGRIIELLSQIDVKLDLWKAQNIYFDIVTNYLGQNKTIESEACNVIKRLGLQLGVEVQV